VGDAILQELRTLREALGELKGLKAEFRRLGDRITNQFANKRPKVWEEDWIMEEDRDWVKQESAAICAEKVDYRKFVRKRREAEEGNLEEVWEPEGKPEAEDKEKGAEEEDEEKEEHEEEEEENEKEVRKSVGPKGETEKGSEEAGASVGAEEPTEEN
jgi:hypothetical protein